MYPVRDGDEPYRPPTRGEIAWIGAAGLAFALAQRVTADTAWEIAEWAGWAAAAALIAFGAALLMRGSWRWAMSVGFTVPTLVIAILLLLILLRL